MLDTQKIRRYFLLNDYKIVDNAKDAEYIVLITCGFTHAVADTSFESIEKYKQYDGELIVVGCVPETHEERLKEVFAGRTISAKALEKIDEVFPGNSVKFADIEDDNTLLETARKQNVFTYLIHLEEKFWPTRQATAFLTDLIVLKITGKLVYKTFPFNRILVDRSNYYIMISRGCIHHCTYCIIRKAIGPLKSKPVEECYNEFERGVQQGFTTIVLEADDVGPYGIDLGTSLPTLLQRMIAVEGGYQIELRNTHPYWLLRYQAELEEILRSKKISSIFFSIQSGSDRVLELMKRHYAVEEIKQVIQRFKEIDPDLKIGVDFLIGFPTETPEDFRKSLALFDDLAFDFGDIIPFSCHEETEASTIDPKVSEKEKRRRILEALRYLRKRKYFALRMRSTGAISFYARKELE